MQGVRQVAVPAGRRDNYSVWLSLSECGRRGKVCYLRFTCYSGRTFGEIFGEIDIVKCFVFFQKTALSGPVGAPVGVKTVGDGAGVCYSVLCFFLFISCHLELHPPLC